jgi:hypothetical protein
LGSDIADHIERGDTNKLDILNIITECLKHPSGLEKIFELVHYVEGDTFEMEELKKTVEKIHEQENDQQRRNSFSILPWLVDRSDQIDKLGEAFREFPMPPSRPVICLLHGDDQACHDKFVERLEEIELADMLPDLRAKGPIREVLLEWPAHTKDLHKKWIVELARAVNNVNAEQSEINAYLSVSPVVVETSLLIQEWSADTAEQINSFVQFWQEWPLAPGQYLIICFCLIYYKPKPHWFFWRGSSIEDMISKVERTLFTLNNKAIVLPRLQSVKLQDAQSWPSRKDVKRYYLEHTLTEELKKIFDNDLNKAIPMNELGKRLCALLDVTAPSQEDEQ